MLAFATRRSLPRVLVLFQAVICTSGILTRYESSFLKDERPSDTACTAWTKFVADDIKAATR